MRLGVSFLVTDAVDLANDIAQAQLDRQIRAARAPSSQRCTACGDLTPHIVAGRCTFCRDTSQ